MAGHNTPRVLLVDDDDAFADGFIRYLEQADQHVDRLARLDGLLDALGDIPYDAVLLGHFVAGSDSLALLFDLRLRYHGPLIVLSDVENVAERIVGLEMGADDFVHKHASPRELLARMRAVMRRQAPDADIARPDALPPGIRRLGVATSPAQWRVSMRARRVTAPDGAHVPLSGIEFDLLVFMAARRGVLVGRVELAHAALGRGLVGSADRTIDNLVSRLRRILMPHLQDSNPIRSVRGRGYMFVGFDLVVAEQLTTQRRLAG